MKKRATILDVARESGVSPATVSRILSGNAKVKDVKTKKVLEVVKLLEYEPNKLAQTLLKGRSDTIGVVSSDLGSYYTSWILYGIESATQDSGFEAMFGTSRWREQDERKAIDLLLARQVDALLIIGAYSTPEYYQQLAKKVPLVILGRSIEGLEDQCLTINNHHGAELATKHLLELGHRNIAHIAGIAGNADAQARRKGYEDTLQAHGIEPNPELIIHGDFLETSAIMAIESFFMRGQNFSAVFAANDQMAKGARLALGRRGMRIPEDVSLVGFDDQAGTAFMFPPLTTVHQPLREMGHGAIVYLIARLTENPAKLFVPELRLVVRESTARIGARIIA